MTGPCPCPRLAYPRFESRKKRQKRDRKDRLKERVFPHFLLLVLLLRFVFPLRVSSRPIRVLTGFFRRKALASLYGCVMPQLQGCLPRRARRRRFVPSAGYQLRLSSACRWASRYWSLQKLQCIIAWLFFCLKVSGGSGGVDGGNGVGRRIQPSFFYFYFLGLLITRMRPS